MTGVQTCALPISSGQRVHGAITLTKEVDKSSPLIFQALAKGEKFTEVKLAFFRLNGSALVQYYTITLKNAAVATARVWVPNCLLATNGGLGHMEDISFSYETIIWDAPIDAVETEDSWRDASA